ncbi:MAG: hypothetical protein ABJL44_07910 [Algibacter sp.]
MKKLSLKNLKLETSDLLKRRELKTVFGGNYGDGLSECENSAFMVGVQAEAAGYSEEEAAWFVQCALAVECYGYSPSDCN